MAKAYIYLSALALALLAFAGTASAEDTTYEGDILVGHPVTGVIGGAPELLDECNPSSDLNGSDGVWFYIGDDVEDDTTFSLTMDPTLNADVWWYDGDCGFISDSGGAQQDIGVTESGDVPDNAVYAIVDGFAGTGSFTLTLTNN